MMYNCVDVGFVVVILLYCLVFVVFNVWCCVVMGGIGDLVWGMDGWVFFWGIVVGVVVVIVFLIYFVCCFEEYDVFFCVDVIWNGIDDDLCDEIFVVVLIVCVLGWFWFVWFGWMSFEKCLLLFLEVFFVFGIDVELEIIGGGVQCVVVEWIVCEWDGICFVGCLIYLQILVCIVVVDVFVQILIGFEMQGMILFEVVIFGMFLVICDFDIVVEFGGGFWVVFEVDFFVVFWEWEEQWVCVFGEIF